MSKQQIDELIDQCTMWCRMTGREPLFGPDSTTARTIISAATVDPKLKFSDLDTVRRRVFAGQEKRT